jgi:hypothetical protein
MDKKSQISRLSDLLASEHQTKDCLKNNLDDIQERIYESEWRIGRWEEEKFDIEQQLEKIQEQNHG